VVAVLCAARLAAVFTVELDALLPHVGQLYALFPTVLGNDDFAAVFPHVGQYDNEDEDVGVLCCTPQVAHEKESVRPV
jgi:hypothetical protein